MGFQKSTQSEEEYFARLEIEKKKKLALEIKAKLQDEERKRLKDLHHMCCPKCGMGLQEVVFKGVVIDKCYSCGVIVLDNGELEKIIGEDNLFLKTIVNLFK